MITESTETLAETSSDNTVLVLYAPDVLGSTKPVEDGDCGVPIHIYDSPPMGAKVRVDAYLGQAPNDTVTLNLNGQLNIASKQTVSTDDSVFLYIPKNLLKPELVNSLTYTVTRGSQNMGTSRPPLEMLYNAIRPGNVDRDPGVDGHSELELILPDVIRNGVGPNFVSAQVCVSYPYCRAFDRIWLNCNGFPVYHDVTPLEAPPPVSATPVTVCFPVTRADLESAKDHAQFKFSYTVTDQVGNNPDPNSPWSATQVVDVDLAGIRLPEPILREIQNDPTDEPSTIDLEKLGSNPLLVIVLTSDHRFQAGDSISATYIATLPGQADVVVPVVGSVEVDEFGQKKPCILQVANDKVLANSVVRVSYQLIRGGVTVAASRTATARVIGEGLPNLQAPRLIKSVNGVLDPLDPVNLQGANGQVEVLGFRAGDTVQLIVKGAPGAGSPTFAAKPLNVNSRANFALSKAFIAANMGKKKLEFIYVLIRGGKSFPSPALTATVGTIPDNHPSLSTPAMDGAIGKELDVTKMQASDQLRVGEWPQQVSGQCVWLRYDGFDTNGVAIFFEDCKGEPHTALPGLIRPAPIEWLKTLKDGSVLTISFRVNFDGVANSATAVTFPVRTYTVSAEHDVPTFTNEPYTIAPAGRLKNVELLLSNSNNTPIPGGKLSLTLPANFMYADGGSGPRDFITDDVGRLSVSRVKGALIPGSYSLSATSGAQVANATVTVTGLGPVGSIPVGNIPVGIAVSPDGTRAYVCNHASHSVSVIETATNRVLTNISVGTSPTGIAVSPDGTRAYVSNQGSDTVSVIKTATNQVLTTIRVGNNPTGVAVSPDGTRAYVCIYGSHTVSVIDTATARVLTTIPVGTYPHGIAVSPDGTRIYVNNYGSHTVSVIDTATNQVLTNIPVGNYPWGVAVSPDGTRAYVCNINSATASVINTATNRVLTNISVGTSPAGIALSPDGTRAYVCNYRSDTVSAINTATNRVLTTIPGGNGPAEIAVSPDGSLVYVCNQPNHTVSVIDTTR
ncbi:beta-propeller fold lactonase family protein [Pseudomonas sp. LB3P58]